MVPNLKSDSMEYILLCTWNKHNCITSQIFIIWSNIHGLARSIMDVHIVIVLWYNLISNGSVNNIIQDELYLLCEKCHFMFILCILSFIIYFYSFFFYLVWIRYFVLSSGVLRIFVLFRFLLLSTMNFIKFIVYNVLFHFSFFSICSFLFFFFVVLVIVNFSMSVECNK